VSYSLVITEEVSAMLKSPPMDEFTHEMFVVAMIHLPLDPHGVGTLVRSEGAFTTRTVAVGSDGLITYVVDEVASRVTIVDVTWLG